ncbi:MAG: xanthine dehydrogenase family protein molybdopterin-binding subunit [Blastocatellia bacterium]|nr:xanthine dehydrogenase family protein molybdopterin-binding subunit [Blastocatellia bacterium]
MAASGLNRRDFLKVSFVAGTGLVLGCHLPGGGKLDVTEAAAVDAQTLNAWVTIAPDSTVTIFAAKAEMGQGIRTSLPMIVAEELDADWNKVKVEHAPGHSTKHGNQGTGGSSSIRTSWKPLRNAGATARAMLVAAAAQKWGVEPAACRTEAGFVINSKGNQRLSYGELAEAAAKVPVPKEVPLKDPKDFKIIGKKTARVDNPKIVDGSAIYGIDVKVPGMLTAVVARCPVFGGKVASFDGSKAKAVPGVRHVLQIPSGVAVVADTFWQAMQGRRALEIKWDEGPNASLNSAAISKMLKEKASGTAAVARKEGAGAEGMKSVAKKLEAVFEVPFLAHATMEPINATAYVQKDSCEIWAGAQFPQFMVQAAQAITQLPATAIKVNVTLLGGGFGRRAEPDAAIEAIGISKEVGTPVKVILTREDDMQHDFYRPASYHTISAGLDAKGNLTAWNHRIVAPSIVGQRWPDQIKNGLDEAAVEGAATIQYHVPHLNVDYVMANTAIPTGWWRSVYNTQNAFVHECFVDEMATAAGKDPYEFRKAHLEKSPRLLAVLNLAAEKAGWGKPLPKGRFRGIACHMSFGSFVAEVVEISVTEEGSIQVHRVVCAADCGIVINPDMLVAQIQGAVTDGLGPTLKGRITIENGQVQQGNFDDYEITKMDETPVVEVHVVPSAENPTGIGEPGLPPIAPAVANAVFAATGKRIRRLPIRPEDLKA